MKYRAVNQRMRIRIVQAGGFVIGATLLLVHPAITGNVHEIIELVGFALVLACVAGRMWSILYVGSKKNLELVTSGPYSMTRNPLYFFSTLGAIGVGLIQGSILVALALGVLTYLVFAATAVREAGYLSELFSGRYDAYARKTPLFWPNLSLYDDAPQVTFSPLALRRTFLDGLFFLSAFPILEAIEQLQDMGYLPILSSVF